MAYNIDKFFDAPPVVNLDTYEADKSEHLIPDRLAALARVSGLCVMRRIIPAELRRDDLYAVDTLAQLRSTRRETGAKVFVAMADIFYSDGGELQTMTLPTYFNLDGLILEAVIDRSEPDPNRNLTVPGVGPMIEGGYALGVPEVS